jgi:hypothetical protein
MAYPPGMEIPESVRQMTEQNIEQARTAYSKLLDTMKKSQEQLLRSTDAMTDATLDLQGKMLRFTEENLEAGFKLATELARARDMKDYFEIQSRHAQRQMQVYALQAQELGQLMAAATQKAQAKR